MKLYGNIHSIETFGTLDGPGIRMVVFMAGCFLRCQYCHNPDITDPRNSRKYTVSEILKEILKNKEYYNSSNGGVTFSGGDPLFQPDFLKAVLKECKKNKIHTAVDTSLYTHFDSVLEEIVALADLFLVSLKHFNDEIHKDLTGLSNAKILENIEKYFTLKKDSPPLWLRMVVIPGITDTAQNLKALIKFTKQINYDRLELLPYNKLGNQKSPNRDLKTFKTPHPAHLKKIQRHLENHGVKNIIIPE